MKQNKMTYQELGDKIWSVADILRGGFRDEMIANVCLLFTLLRRVDALLLPCNGKVVAAYRKLLGRVDENGLHAELTQAAGGKAYYNKSGLDFAALAADESKFPRTFSEYIDGFSPLMKEIFAGLDFNKVIFQLNKYRQLYTVFTYFYTIDMSEAHVDGNTLADILFHLAMRVDADGMIMNDKEGIVDTLLAQLLVANGQKAPATIYDPTCGSCHSLLMAKAAVGQGSRLYGQDLNSLAMAVTRAMAIVKGENDLLQGVKMGDTLCDDQYPDVRFDYVVASLPFGLSWKDSYRSIQTEAKRSGTRFFAGLPSIGDSQFLFIQHIISKLAEGGRACFLTSYSALITGAPDAAENHVRKYLVEHDMLDALIYLHHPLRNTAIDVVLWVIDKDKQPQRRGKVQIINVRDNDVATILDLYQRLENTDGSQVITNGMIGENEITVMLPNQGKITVPAPADVDLNAYFATDIAPYVPAEAYIDEKATARNYVIYIDDADKTTLRTPEEVEAELREMAYTDMAGTIVSEENPVYGSSSEEHPAGKVILGLLLTMRRGDELPQEGDVLIRAIGGQMQAYRSGEQLPGVPSSILVAKPSEQLLPDYLALVSQTRGFVHDVARYAPSLGGRYRVSSSTLMHIRIPLPSLDRQRAMISKNQALLRREDHLRRQLALMEEYRKSVIEQSLSC